MSMVRRADADELEIIIVLGQLEIGDVKRSETVRQC